MTSLPGEVSTTDPKKSPSTSGRQSKRGNLYEPSNESKKQYEFFIMVKKYLHEWPKQAMSELEIKYNELLKKPIPINNELLKQPIPFNELKGDMETSTFLKEEKLDFDKLDKVFPKEPNGEFLSELDEFDYGREENINDFRIKIYDANKVKRFLSVVPNKLFFIPDYNGSIPDYNGSIRCIYNEKYINDKIPEVFLKNSLQEHNTLTLLKLPKAKADGVNRGNSKNYKKEIVIATKKILPVVEGYDIKDMQMIAQKIFDWQTIISRSVKSGGGPIQPRHAFAAAMNHYKEMDPPWPSDVNGYYTKRKINSKRKDGQLHEDLQGVIYRGDGLYALEDWFSNITGFADKTIFGNIYQHGDKEAKSDYTLFKEFLETFDYGKHLEAAYNDTQLKTIPNDKKITVHFKNTDVSKENISTVTYNATELAEERYKSLRNFPSRIVKMIPGLLVRHINYTVFQKMEGPLDFYEMASNIMYGHGGGKRHTKPRTRKRNQRKAQKGTKNKRR
jgi:hypothetical protein